MTTREEIKQVIKDGLEMNGVDPDAVVIYDVESDSDLFSQIGTPGEGISGFKKKDCDCYACRVQPFSLEIMDIVRKWDAKGLTKLQISYALSAFVIEGMALYFNGVEKDKIEQHNSIKS